MGRVDGQMTHKTCDWQGQDGAVHSEQPNEQQQLPERETKTRAETRDRANIQIKTN
jgi:hypothetical protein